MPLSDNDLRRAHSVLAVIGERRDTGRSGRINRLNLAATEWLVRHVIALDREARAESARAVELERQHAALARRIAIAQDALAGNLARGKRTRHDLHRV